MTDPTWTPELDDVVTAREYHGNRFVTGLYKPRDYYQDTGAPEGAAWIDAGESGDRGRIMIRESTVRPGEPASVAARLREASTSFARVVAEMGQMPPLPFLRIDPEGPQEPQPVDPRTAVVEVRTVLARPAQLEQGPGTHTYSDPDGLTWQTYGQEHNFSTDRMLEIHNRDGDIIATYPPGSWMHVRYLGYLQSGETR